MDPRQLGYARYCEASDMVQTHLCLRDAPGIDEAAWRDTMRKYAARVIGYHAA